VDERIVGHKPATLNYAEAAALPLTAVTAWEALFDRLGIDPAGSHVGRSILLIGGAGGVGSVGLQLARLAGLKVLTTASRRDSAQWCRSMGADHVIDHRHPLRLQIEDVGLRELDYIANFNNTDDYWTVMADLIRPQGRICAIVDNRAAVDLRLLQDKSVTFAWESMFTRPRFETDDMQTQHELLDQVAALVDQQRLRTTLTETLRPIDAANLRQAHAKVESGKTIGKIVVEGWP
jgi:zinc-binding alcohol dehydrogenase family protein